jgi:hypothetical protein
MLVFTLFSSIKPAWRGQAGPARESTCDVLAPRPCISVRRPAGFSSCEPAQCRHTDRLGGDEHLAFTSGATSIYAMVARALMEAAIPALLYVVTQVGAAAWIDCGRT